MLDLEDGWDFHIGPQGKGHPSEEKLEAGKERGAKAVASAQRTQGVKGGVRKTESSRWGHSVQDLEHQAQKSGSSQWVELRW